MREEIMAVKKEVKEIQENSIAMSILSSYKRQCKMFFISWLVTFIAFICLLGYTLWLYNDIGTETTTETYEVEQDNNSGNNNFINGNNNEVK